MKTFNTYFTSPQELKKFIKDNNIEDSKSLLIQIFTSNNNETFIKSLTSHINKILPLSALIGSTTDGEIKDGLVSTYKTVVSFTTFEKTTLKTYISNSFDNCFEAGSTLMHNLNEKKIKVIISFIDGLHGNGEDFLNGVDSVNKDVVVAGGLAGDNAAFERTYVFTKDNIFKNGVVGVGLSSDCLNVTTDYSFNWVTVGLDLKITKSTGNRVYTIDDKTAYEAYSYYLGEETAKALPAVGIEFPLIVNRNGTNIARAVIQSELDGSLIFGGNLKEGDTVKFGYGDSEGILDNVKQKVNYIAKNPVESIFIYSSMARRRFVPELIETEISPYREIAPVAGFFTNGEFYTSSSRKELLNQSMSILALSESDTIKEGVSFNDKVDTNKNNSIKSLSHLMKVSSNELETLNIMLENRVEDEIEKNREKTKQIIEQKQLFETIFDKSKDGILILEDDEFIDCNGAAVEMLNYSSRENLLSKHPYELSPEYQLDGSSSSEKLMQHINNALKKGSDNFEWLYTKYTGEDFWVEVHLNDISTEDKNLLFVVWRDIDEKKKTEAKLEELNRTLEDRIKEEVEKNIKKENEHKDLKLAEQKAKYENIAKSSFLANMSHEIRTPMNAIIGFINILIKKEASDEKLSKLNIIKKSSAVLLDIINDILDFSKIESGKLSIEKTLFDTREPFSAITNLFHDKSREKNIELKLRFDENLPPKGYGDTTRIKQICANLLSNAIKFSPENSDIYVHVQFDKQKNRLICSVEDNGKGIKAENLTKIFTEFEQEDSSITRNFGGTGLGLSICKTLTELMGGSIEVKSEFNKGSTFTFYLDIFSNIPDIENEKELIVQSDEMLFEGKILIVEDNKTNQLLLISLLEDFDVEVVIANDGLEAVELYKNGNFSLILMDENMPNMNGIEATRHIRTLELNNQSKTPIVAVTANALVEDRKRFLEAGLDDYIAKPIDIADLERVLAKFLVK